LVDWYFELRSANPAGFGHHQPLTYSEILAFKTVYELDLDAFDVDTLRRLDALWLKLRPKRDDSRAPGGSQSG
jgi:hypothetical protein